MNTTERLQRSRIGLLLDEPFFGSLLMGLKCVPQSCGTAMTNGRILAYDPAYVDQLDDTELKTVLAHEVLHCALLHPYRIGERELGLYNEACDHAVNLILQAENDRATAAKRTTPFKLRSTWLCDPQFEGQPVEEIYHTLLARRPKSSDPDSQNQNSQNPGSSAGSGQGSAPGNSTAPSSPSQSPSSGAGTGQSSAPSSSPASKDQLPPATGPGDFCPPPGTPDDQATDEANWKVAIHQAATLAKARGHLPGDLDRLVQDLIHPPTPWQEILRNFLTSFTTDDYSWTRPNPRYAASGFILPSLRSPHMGRIAVAIDTSGSVDADTLRAFLSECQAILTTCRPDKLILIGCDSAIHDWHEIEPWEDIPIQLKGGGGTNFRPVFQRLAEEPESPCALVYITDLEGRFPDQEPPFQTLWATNNPTHHVPFGHILDIEG